MSKNLNNLLINIVALLTINLLMKIKFASYIFEKIFQKKYNYKKYSSNFKLTKLDINENYLTLITELDEKHYTFESIYDIHLVDIYIVIRTTVQMDIFIPNRAFKSDLNKQSFLNKICKLTNLKVKEFFPIDIY
ncbi:hypothetical protein CLFE_017090 [Clostridium felsineum DSM 794]|nr:hypothetical protein CLFE_017090 [Clostridium felsineum DSM 794]